MSDAQDTVPAEPAVVETPEVQATPEAVQPPAPDAFQGIQKRIDELTARYHEVDRVRQDLALQNQTLMQALTEKLAQQSVQVINQEPEYSIPDNIDPDTLKVIEAVTQKSLKQIEQRQSQFEAFLSQQRAEQVLSSADPAIAADAKKLLDAWSAKKLQGWTPEDAVVYAAGQRALAQLKAGDSQRKAFAAVEQPIATQAAPPPVASSSGASTPKDIDKWPAEKQAAYYEKLLDGKLW